MIPLRDENRSKTTPHVTRFLIFANIILFIPILYYTLVELQLIPSDSTMLMFVESFFSSFVMIPSDVIQLRNLHTLVTSMFLHADLFHISGNLLFLYIFGDNVEDTLGHFRFLGFYLLAGLVASITHILSLSGSEGLLIPTLGASGAISGVLGAYIIMYPKARVLTLLLIRLVWVVRIPAAIFLGFWFFLQLLYTSLGIGGGVAYWAHIGGFIVGVVLALILRVSSGKRDRSNGLILDSPQ
ncbi:MAG: rhomboid family intramembrane serine protease [Candidatus Bathyarchaeota archaeon]|nr:MAG: rhomboid family intramembrane serine protease [Candidatus Bathyarchaeota archaeon]